MEVEIQDPAPETVVRYSDIRTGRLFTWWNAEFPFTRSSVFLKGQDGYTRLSNADYKQSPWPAHNPRVVKLVGKIIVQEL